MEKTLKTLNVTMNKNSDAKMMMMALVNHSLATKMGCSDIVTEIMDDTHVKLSDEETIFVAKRIIAAVNKYHDSKVSCNSKEQRYEKLMSLVTSEVGKETDLIRMIYSDVSERYDVSELSTSEVAEVSCWLAVKSILWVLPATESLVAAQTYKKQRRTDTVVKPEDVEVIEKTSTSDSNDDTEELLLPTTTVQVLKDTEDISEMIECLIGVLTSEDRADIYHQIMSEVEIDFAQSDWEEGHTRLSSAIGKYEGLYKKSMSVSERYECLVEQIVSEISQMSALSDISSDVAEIYDVSKITIGDFTVLLCWLVVANLISNPAPVVVEEEVEEVFEPVKQVKNQTPKPVKQVKNQTPKPVKRHPETRSGLLIFQARDLRRAVAAGDYSASTMYSIFG